MFQFNILFVFQNMCLKVLSYEQFELNKAFDTSFILNFINFRKGKFMKGTVELKLFNNPTVLYKSL